VAAGLPAAASAGRRHGLTVARYLRVEWLPARRDQLRPTTLFRYSAMIDRYIVPYIGQVPIRRLTVRDLRSL